jgi:hypothetical protein
MSGMKRGREGVSRRYGTAIRYGIQDDIAIGYDAASDLSLPATITPTLAVPADTCGYYGCAISVSMRLPVGKKESRHTGEQDRAGHARREGVAKQLFSVQQHMPCHA